MMKKLIAVPTFLAAELAYCCLRSCCSCCCPSPGGRGYSSTGC